MNKSTICLSNNPEFHSRTKHIHIRYHYVRDTIEQYSIKIEYISTEDNISDILTKGLPKIKHYKIIELIGLQKVEKSSHTNHLTIKSKSDVSISKMSSETYYFRITN